MSLFLPFNFRPASLVPISGSYTVPSGQYALVRYNLNVNAYVSGLNLPTNLGSYLATGEHFNTDYTDVTENANGEFWAPPGTVINFNSSAPSGSASIQVQSNVGSINEFRRSNYSTSPYIEVTVNGTGVARCRARASCTIWADVDSPSGSNQNASISMTSATHFSACVQLFDIP